MRWLMQLGYVPSFCTSCYGNGRVGEDFMALCKKQLIHNFCTPNALLTLKEYLDNYASPETRRIGISLLAEEMNRLPEAKRLFLQKRMEFLKEGKVVFF